MTEAMEFSQTCFPSNPESAQSSSLSKLAVGMSNFGYQVDISAPFAEGTVGLLYQARSLTAESESTDEYFPFLVKVERSRLASKDASSTTPKLDLLQTEYEANEHLRQYPSLHSYILSPVQFFTVPDLCSVLVKPKLVGQTLLSLVESNVMESSKKLQSLLLELFDGLIRENIYVRNLLGENIFLDQSNPDQETWKLIDMDGIESNPFDAAFLFQNEISRYWAAKLQNCTNSQHLRSYSMILKLFSQFFQKRQHASIIPILFSKSFAGSPVALEGRVGAAWHRLVADSLDEPTFRFALSWQGDVAIFSKSKSRLLLSWVNEGQPFTELSWSSVDSDRFDSASNVMAGDIHSHWKIAPGPASDEYVFLTLDHRAILAFDLESSTFGVQCITEMESELIKQTSSANQDRKWIQEKASKGQRAYSFRFLK